MRASETLIVAIEAARNPGTAEVSAVELFRSCLDGLESSPQSESDAPLGTATHGMDYESRRALELAVNLARREGGGESVVGLPEMLAGLVSQQSVRGIATAHEDRLEALGLSINRDSAELGGEPSREAEPAQDDRVGALVQTVRESAAGSVERRAALESLRVLFADVADAAALRMATETPEQDPERTVMQGVEATALALPMNEVGRFRTHLLWHIRHPQ